MRRALWLIVALAVFLLAVPASGHFNNPARDHPFTGGVNDHGTGAINFQCGLQRVYVRAYPTVTWDIGNVRLRVRDFDTGTWYGVAWNNVNVADPPNESAYWLYKSSRDDVSAVEQYFDYVGGFTESRMVYGCYWPS